jgi:hypothetical protein
MEAFAKTEEPLGWWLAGRLSGNGRDRFDYFKKSADGGCSWGQVGYGWYFKLGNIVEQDKMIYAEWLEKAANQNNPEAMDWLGEWLLFDKEDVAIGYYRAAAELGWKNSMVMLSQLLKDGEFCRVDLSLAIIWSAKAKESCTFWDILTNAERMIKVGQTELFGSDLNHLFYSMGWGLYWYLYEGEDWDHRSDEDKVSADRSLGYYCSCVELQQKSIFTFLLCWNSVVGMKDVGAIIAEMVWEGREENLVMRFEL